MRVEHLTGPGLIHGYASMFAVVGLADALVLRALAALDALLRGADV